jgi:hypothetical protein
VREYRCARCPVETALFQPLNDAKERNTIEFVKHGLVESFTDPIGLWALRLST